MNQVNLNVILGCLTLNLLSHWPFFCRVIESSVPKYMLKGVKLDLNIFSAER